MDEPQTNDSSPSSGLSEDERAQAFAGTMVGSRVTYSKKTVLWFLVVLALLGTSGSIVEFVANQGSGSTTSTLAPSTTQPAPTVTVPSTGRSLSASLAAILALKKLKGDPAPPISLTTSSGRAWSLASQHGHEVILTFFGANCEDICPVLGAELRQALVDLGPAAARVRVAIVNTNPNITAPAKTHAALSSPGLNVFTNVTFLTGTLPQLNQVWTNYGVQVTAATSSNLVAHNNIIYFIDAKGHLRYLATPFANESATGAYTLDATEITRFAKALASQASSLDR